MDRRHKTASEEAKYHARRKIVFPKTVAQLEVLVEHGAQGKWNRLEMDIRDSGVRMKRPVLFLA